ncbi:alpha/beta hydrolase family protein [Pseudonocardia sediminis]|uniref:Alpha/beta hydrolase family protein n=1 Tax=Pseudonocardia sediminis TaxID=1397368 RepID=A0A4Q7UZ02_PSEST|nr:alpha/beta hydrolase [Pseudonocardia sediminis]RZT87025.1 alpha/beta hydrolase family protein [Pseudonocardia sediminis]
MFVRARCRRSSGRPARTTAILAAVVASVALLGACADTSTESEGAPAPTPPELAAFYDQQLSWGPCSGFAGSSADTAAFADPKFDCTRVEVPLDYAKPDGEKAQVALLRQKASGGPKIGSLFFDPGGPGASGTSYLANASASLAPTLGQRFDLIGFDPRGTGASLPKIDCLNDRENDQERAKVFTDPSPAGVAAAEADSKAYADRCAQRVGTDVLANMGTRDASKDMDVLRAAVGDQKMNYVGYSYGTELGTAYAEAFPQNVRALVLDGAIDPTQTTVDSSVKQAAGFQLAFENYAKWCATQNQQQSPCPLGTDPAQATRAFNTIAQRLIDNPVPVGDGRDLSFDDAITGVTQALYVSEYWPVLSRGISEVANGQGRILQILADSYYERDEQGRYTNMLEAFQSISCVNQKPVTDPAEVRELNEKANEAAPFRATGRGVVAAKDACAFWPVPPTSEPHTPNVQGLPPVVVVSVTGDPATPYQAGVDLAAQLKGSLIKVNGEQHTASLRGNACLDDQVVAYLVDLKTPGAGAECTLDPA